MRFYDLQITDPKTGRLVQRWQSHPNGVRDPGALNIVFSVFSAPAATPVGGSTIIVEGVDTKMLTGARQFSNMLVTLSGGMQNGLPLATPANNGVLVSGIAYQSFANWQGSQVSLAFVLRGDPYAQNNPGNIVLNWRAGTSLVAALKNCLTTAYPTAAIKINIKDRTLPFDEIHFGDSLADLATFIARITSGQHEIAIAMNANIINVFDDTFKKTPKRLNFFDFIGQPMWIEKDTIQIKSVLRGDISVGDTIEMPTMPNGATFPSLPGFVQTAAASQPSQYKYQSAMSGKFVVNNQGGVRHIGNFRMPDGNAWCTVINAAAQTVATAP